MIHNLNKESKPLNIGLGLLILSQIFFIAGSLLVNLLTISSIILFFLFSRWKNNYEFLKNYKIVFIIITLILLINILSSDLKLLSTTKILAYLRFPLFAIAVIYFLESIKSKINIYLSFLYALIIFLIFDSLIQFYFGKDIFGYSYNFDYLRISGPFGDEWIIGFYLFNIGFLTLSYVNFFSKIRPTKNILFILIISLTVLYTGERTTYFSIYIFLILLIIISNKKKLLAISSILLIIFSLILINQPFGDKRGNFLSMKYKMTNLPAVFKSKEEINEKKNDNKIEKKSLLPNQITESKWSNHFLAGINIFNKNLLTGSGFRTFRIVCYEYERNFNDTNKQRCSTHPHNFHIEILSDNGILGYAIFLSFFIYISIIFLKEKLYRNFGCSILFCLIITFIFPIKTTGSFFTTNTSYLFFLLIAHFFNLRNQFKLSN
tara:strand:- start:596 stop:1897 length:1302 start_codon:yes stop_codon:yes gene_type:complete